MKLLNKSKLVKHHFTKEEFTARTFDGIFSKKVTPFEAVVILYTATADGKDFKEVHIPWELEEFAKFTYEANGFSKDLLIVDLELIPSTYKRYEDVIMTFFTGGKDSFTAYVKYSHLRDIDINVFYKGINKLYPNEWKNAEKLAKELDIELDIVETKGLAYITNQTESPIKNLMTYILSIERYQLIPRYFSFGNVSGFEVDNYNNIVENEYNEEYIDMMVDYKIENEDKVLDLAGVQGSLVSGDSPEAADRAEMFLDLAYGYDNSNTFGAKDEAEAYQYMLSYGFGQYTSGCLSSVQWKQGHRERLNKKYSLCIEGKDLIAGTVSINSIEGNCFIKIKELSIFELEDRLKTEAITINTKTGTQYIKDITELKLEDVSNQDFIGPYECGVCIKCAERYIIYAKHFGFNYRKEFIPYCKESILRFITKDQRQNSNELGPYLIDLLGITWSDISSKFRRKLTVKQKATWDESSNSKLSRFNKVKESEEADKENVSL